MCLRKLVSKVIHSPLSMYHAILPWIKPLSNKSRLNSTFPRRFSLHDGGNGLSDRNINIFTTTAELPWAGHPTIGTICYLCTNTSSIKNAVQRFTLHTKAGPIAALYDRGKRLAIASIPHNIHVHKSQVRWEHILRAQPHLIQDEKSNRQSNIKSWC